MNARQHKTHNQDTAPAKPAESFQKAAVTHLPAWAGGKNDQITAGLLLQDASTIPGIQAKLTISQLNDLYEQEADHVAEQAFRMLASPAAVQHIWAQRKQ